MTGDVTQPEENTCRVENVGKFAVPICGHDVITEFMVKDLKTRPTNGVLLYGGLYANESEDRFFWYVSTIRSFGLSKVSSVVDGGKRVSQYLAEVMKGNRIQTLYEAYERPLSAKSDEEGIEALINLGLMIRTENGTVKITTKGIELCCVLAHLTVNHQVKPPPDQLNKIFESLVRVGFRLEELQEEPDDSLTVDLVMDKLSEKGELEHLEEEGIEQQKLRDMIQLYLCPPF